MASWEYQGKHLAQGTRLMREYLLRLLQPGDILVYSGEGIFSKLIKLKTYSEWTHVAVYIGGGLQREFVEGAGAQEVPFRPKNLGMIRRRLGIWERSKSDAFWQEVKDQDYDYVGILWSFFARKQGRDNHSMFCSEYVVRDDRVASTGPTYLVSDETDADGVSPADLVRSPASKVVWMAKDGHR